MCDEKDKLLRAVLQAFPEGLLVSQLGFEYKKLVGEDVQFRYYGFTSQLEYLRTKNQVCTVYDLESGDTMVKAKPTPSTAHLTRMIRHQKESNSGYNLYTQNALKYNEMRKNRKIPEPVKTNLQKMLVDHENGVMIVNICRMYSTRFGQYLEIQHFGFQNIHEFVNDGLLMEKDFDIKNGRLFYTGDSFKPERPQGPVQPFVVQYHVDWDDDMKKNTPMYSVDQTVLALLQKGSLYSVAWTYVKNPRSIGLFLISEAERMHSLRNKMGAHYQLYHGLLRLKNVIKDQIVVVQENDFWCRGRVAEIKEGGQYLVTILDSGHNSIHSKIYKIRPGFLEYPFMGFKAFLDCSASLTEPHRQEFKKVIKDVFNTSELLMKVEDIVKEKVQVKLFERRESGQIRPLKYNFS